MDLQIPAICFRKGFKYTLVQINNCEYFRKENVSETLLRKQIWKCEEEYKKKIV